MATTTRSTAGVVFSSIFLLIARVAFGIILVAHAWWRFSTVGMGKQVEVLTQVGFPMPELFAWGTLVLEGVGGALMVIGLLTRVVAAFVVAQNVTTIAWLKWNNGFWLVDNGFEYNAALAALGLVFFAVGAAHTGVDAVLFRSREPKDPKLEPYYPSTSSSV